MKIPDSYTFIWMVVIIFWVLILIKSMWLLEFGRQNVQIEFIFIFLFLSIMGLQISFLRYYPGKDNGEQNG